MLTGPDARATIAADQAVVMTVLTINSVHRLSLRAAVESHGWARLAPWHWDGCLERLSRLDKLSSGVVAEMSVLQSGPYALRVEVGGALDRQGEEEVKRLVERWLSVGWDPTHAVEAARRIDHAMATRIKEGTGRLLRCSTFYEDFCKTVCTINTSWAGTLRMCSGLVTEIGGGLFPTPRQVLDAGVDALSGGVRMGFRSRVLYEATGTLLDRGLMDEDGKGREDAITYDELLTIRGIGPYAASHTAALLHDFSRVPVDSEVRRFCLERYGLAEDEIEAYFDAWGEYRFLGYKLVRLATA